MRRRGNAASGGRRHGPCVSGGPGKERYIVVDERHVGAEDLPGRNLMWAVLGLEQGRTPKDVMRVAGLLAQWLRDPRDDEPKRAFTDWVWRLAGQFEPGDAEWPAVRTLEGVKMTLEERLAEWPKQWLREGRELGMKEGLEQGVEQGLAHERALLRRQVASRFGAETAECLSGMLAGIMDPEDLADVGEWLVRCETGSEFLARVDPAANDANRCGDSGDPHAPCVELFRERASRWRATAVSRSGRSTRRRSKGARQDGFAVAVALRCLPAFPDLRFLPAHGNERARRRRVPVALPRPCGRPRTRRPRGFDRQGHPSITWRRWVVMSLCA